LVKGLGGWQAESKSPCFVEGEAKIPQQCGVLRKGSQYSTCSLELRHEPWVRPSLLQNCEYTKMSMPKKRTNKKQRHRNLRANRASTVVRIKGILFLRRGFFGSRLSGLGGAGIVDIISFPLVPWRNGERRRDRAARFRRF
jgi:hypothetical protein